MSHLPIRNFDFKGRNVRVVTGTDGEPWWVAKDVCEIIEIANSSQALARLDADERGVINVEGANQHGSTPPVPTAIINESGLYSLILTSRKPEAKAFKKWITSEVLPSIRKTGQYRVDQAHEVPGDPLLIALQSAIEIRNRQVALESRQDAQDEKLAAIEAKADAALSPGGDDFMAIVGFLKLKRCKASTMDCSAIGKRLSAYCKRNGIPMGQAQNEIWGKINLYLPEILQSWWDGKLVIANHGPASPPKNGRLNNGPSF